jgi:uncharacterized protein (DUF488 family)
MDNSRKNIIFTIGHSNHTLEKFVELLRQHEVTTVVDVRSAPYSKWQPQFSKESLTDALKKLGIDYLFFGKELGARSDDPSCYENGKVQYRRLAKTYLFRQGLERVLIECETRRMVLMCAEKDPLDCHRTLLVARELASAGVQVLHIHPDGHLESHFEAMTRLLKLMGMPEEDLFQSESERIDQACARQEERIAYTDINLSRESGENF